MALTAAVALFVLSNALHDATDQLRDGIESVRLSTEVQIALLSRGRLGPAGTEVLRSRVVDLRRYAGNIEERQMVDDVERRLAEYLAGAAATQAGSWPPPPPDLLQALQALIDLNVAQATVVEQHAARWARLADLAAVGVAILLLVGVATPLVWIRLLAFRPLLALSHAMHRFGSGDATARAPEAGPAELRGMAREFNELAERLVQQRERQFAFLAGVAHDLRNPLAPLRLAAEVMGSADRPLGEGEMRHTLGIVRRQVERIDRLAGDLIDAARIEAGQLELRLRKCDLVELVARLADEQRLVAPQHEINTFLPDSGVPALCDPQRLEQLLENLVRNSIKYSPDGGSIDVALRVQGGQAVITVADQGMGIATEDLPGVFEPFRRTEAARSAAPGVGLGLWVARRLAEAHGGTLSAESTPSAGSTFTLVLPVENDAGASRLETTAGSAATRS